MLRRLACWSVAAGILSTAACGGGETPAPAPTTAVIAPNGPAAPSSASPSSPSVQIKTPSSPSPGAQPDLFLPVELGAACDPAAAQPIGKTLSCGRGNRTSMVEATGVNVPPFPPVAISRRTATEVAGVYVDGARIIAQIDCTACRQTTRSLLVADPSLMTEPQLVNLQQRLALPKAPVLTTAEAWRKALMDAPASP